jgi:2-polyprenyl-3-methyl-5-hydroxy-6-metoxy-1,4-benzoquinol methylase
LRSYPLADVEGACIVEQQELATQSWVESPGQATTRNHAQRGYGVGSARRHAQGLSLRARASAESPRFTVLAGWNAQLSMKSRVWPANDALSDFMLECRTAAGKVTIEFTAHNIRLDNGDLTKPDLGYVMDQHPWAISAKRTLSVVFPGEKSQIRIADLGCLEGGYSVEIARMGFQVLGLEVRESNLVACRYVKEHTDLPNLVFVKDDAWNLAKHGPFDAVFCCGLLYHLDRPKRFLQLLSAVTSRLLILQTHFATEQLNPKFPLSALTENESMEGRWYTEYADSVAHQNRENAKWASWDNPRSFWPKRDHLLQAIQDAGFDLVAEQYDSLGSSIVNSMHDGYYKTDDRGTFLGIKTRQAGPG